MRPCHAVGAAALLLATLTGIGAMAVPAAAAVPTEPSALCLPLILTCSTPTPSPSPTARRSPTPSTGGSSGGALGPDTGAPDLTLPAAQLSGSSISITGIRQLGLVTVHTLDGTPFTVIKLEADDVTITGFVLDVRRATGPSLVSTADTMHLHGHVQVWLDSLTATTLGGQGLTLGTHTTPIPGDELPSELLRVDLGLIGTTADSITYSNLHQSLHE
jgi:hypothetical protein